MAEPEVRVDLPGQPRGWGRTMARVVKPKDKPAFVHHYQDAETRNEQAMLRYAAERALGGRPPLDGPLIIRIIGVFTPPASWSAKKRAEAIGGLIRPETKPDFDNLVKLACDAFNKVLWVDDARIVEARIAKWYGDKPFYRIEVWRWRATLV